MQTTFFYERIQRVYSNKCIHCFWKREKGKQTIQLIPTTDIAAELGKIKKDRQITIGFALETDNEITNATEKLRKKNLDFIVLNSLQNPGAGFQYDTNQISIITQEIRIDFPL